LKGEGAGYRWYRTAVDLPPFLQGRELAIGFGPVEEVYEVYAEGFSVGRFGHWLPQPASPANRNLVFPVSPGLIRGSTLHIRSVFDIVLVVVILSVLYFRFRMRKKLAIALLLATSAMRAQPPKASTLVVEGLGKGASRRGRMIMLHLRQSCRMQSRPDS
jgi:hypothetical protein